MDDPLSPCGTQIDDLPSCLIIDILSRLPIKSLVISRSVCKSWLLLFSDPLFVQLHRARSHSHLFRRESRKFRCTTLEIPGENFELEVNATLPDNEFIYVNSSHGLVCSDYCESGTEIYICNPILGEYITICSRSNQFKVLQISGIAPPMAEIYTIGNGARHWKSIGIAPSYLDLDDNTVETLLNGSIHWIDRESHNITFFNFESEQFGSLPLPPVWSDGRLSTFRVVRVRVVNGCLCIYAGVAPCEQPELRVEFWTMKEYGVEESWTITLSLTKSKFDLDDDELVYLSRTLYNGDRSAIYNPSFISLQDVAKGEQLTVMSRTRTLS